eukprot:7744117-Karenia_brevis.AAC.1
MAGSGVGGLTARPPGAVATKMEQMPVALLAGRVADSAPADVGQPIWACCPALQSSDVAFFAVGIFVAVMSFVEFFLLAVALSADDDADARRLRPSLQPSSQSWLAAATLKVVFVSDSEHLA